MSRRLRPGRDLAMAVPPVPKPEAPDPRRIFRRRKEKYQMSSPKTLSRRAFVRALADRLHVGAVTLALVYFGVRPAANGRSTRRRVSSRARWNGSEVR